MITPKLDVPKCKLTQFRSFEEKGIQVNMDKTSHAEVARVAELGLSQMYNCWGEKDNEKH